MGRSRFTFRPLPRAPTAHKGFFEGIASFRGLWVAVAPRLEWVVNSPASLVVLLGEILDVPLFSIWSAAVPVLMLGIAVRYASRLDTLGRALKDAPALYLTGAAGAVAIAVVHGLGLWMWSRSGPPAAGRSPL